MEYVQATYHVTYKVFTPGEVVRPTSRRCPLPDGEYVVTRYTPPLSAGDSPIIFVEGHPRGVDAEYITSVSHPCEHPGGPSVEEVREPVVIAGPHTATAGHAAETEPGPGYTPTRGRSGKGLVQLGG
jgi:hypothetical protein